MRRKGRVCALQILYQLDLGRHLEGVGPSSTVINEAIERYWSSFGIVSAGDRGFAERLVRGVAGRLDAMHRAIADVSHNWRLERMDKVDRNVMRIAAYEILYCPDIPKAASINEALEIAKSYSGQDSAAFINGVLDKLAKSADDATTPLNENIEA